MRPVCGRNVRGSSAYSRTSTAWPAAAYDVVERFAFGDADLLLDEVDARDELRHGVLDLDAAVQLEEVEVPAVEHELGRPGAPIGNRLGERDCGVAHRLPQPFVDRYGWGLLEHFLVAALDGALAFAECEHGARAVSQQLDLDMAWALDVPLAKDAVVAERGFGLPPRGGERLFQLFGGLERRACLVRRRPRPP